MNLENHIDAKLLSSDLQLECDVVVVGSGAGGGTVAKALCEKGYRVIIVEEGALKTKFNMQERSAYRDLYQDLGGRTTSDKAIKILQGKNVGGGTTINWTASFRTPESTLSYWRTQFNIKDISQNELTPYFEKVEREHSISKWHMKPNKNNASIAKACEKLNWKYDILKRNVKGCINSGFCGIGCPVDAKQGVLLTAIPYCLSQGAKLITHARVMNLDVYGDHVVSLKAYALNPDNSRVSKTLISITAKTYVLAAGGIGTPAILLRSLKQNKILDPYKNIGKRTFLHPVTAVSALMPYKVHGEYGAPQSVYSDQFVDRGEKLGYKLEVAPMQPALFSTVFYAHGREHTNLMQQRPYMSNMIALMKDGFHEQSTGGEVYLDSYDLPKLGYPLNTFMQEGFRSAIEKMGEAFFAINAKKVYLMHTDSTPHTSLKSFLNELQHIKLEKHHLNLFSAHVMGGCLMSEDSNIGVVNSNGRHHQVGNLFIADGSIFPTSIGANPMQSIYTFANKIADSIKVD